MSLASALYTLGFPEENRAFIDSIGSIESRLRHPGERGDDTSSDEELTGDEGNWTLLPREEARKRRVAREEQEKEQQQQRLKQAAPTGQQQGPSKTRTQVAEAVPMEGVEEQPGAHKSKKLHLAVALQIPAPVAGPSKPAQALAPPRRLSPLPVASTSGTKPPKPTSRTLHVPKPPPFPAELVNPAPVASTSGLGRAPAPKPLASSEDSDSDIEIIEEPTLLPKKKAALPKPSPPLKTSPKKRNSEVTANTSRSPKKRGKVYKLSELVTKDKKKGAKGIQDEWKTISTYIDRLEDLVQQSAPVQKTFANCRVLTVHPDLRTGKSEHNRIDLLLVHRLGLLAGAGATLVKPEDFLAPPLGSKPTTDPWTTHIMLPEIPGTKTPSFSRLLECVGPQGVKVEDLGDFVHVVREEWMAAWMTAKEQGRPMPDPTQFYLRDDPRQKVASPAKKKVGKSRRDDRGKGKGRAGDSDTEDEREHEREGGESMSHNGDRDDAVSSFGSQDYPAGERPPPEFLKTMATAREKDGYMMVDHATADSTSASDPIVDPTPTAKGDGDYATMEGLEDQLRYINEQGEDHVDQELDALDDEFDRIALQADPNAQPIPKNKHEFKREYVYISLEAPNIAESDYETEEEENGGRQKSKTSPKGFGVFKKSGKDRYYRKSAGYACDRGSSNRPAVGPNESTARILDELAKANVEDQWRERGYRNAANALRNCPHHITTFNEAKNIHNIGERIATKIVEIAQTGTHRKLNMTTGRDRTITQFSYIYGVGRNVAAQLYDKGARTIQDLIEDPQLYDLTDSQKLGLKYYEDLKERIPREEVTEIYQYAVKIAAEIDPKLEVYCMGSYRRGATDCGDIDLLVTRNTNDGIDHTGMIKKLWDGLVEAGIARHCLTSSDDWNDLDAKFNALCALPGGLMRRLDILGVPRDELPAALIYFTGNDHFNRSLRLKARHYGLRLNQRGLYKDVSRGVGGIKLTEGKKIECETEKDIFDILQVPWRPPEQRIP